MEKKDMREFWDCVDADLSKFEAHVNRFYSDRQWLVISCTPRAKRRVLATMCSKHGWTLYDAGGCGDSLLLTLRYDEDRWQRIDKCVEHVSTLLFEKRHRFAGISYETLNNVIEI